jgi:hypothetical protein
LRKTLSGNTLLEHGEEIVLAHDQVLLAVDLDLGAAVLREQHLVARLDVEGDQLALLVALAGADGDDLRLDGLLLGGVRDEQATGGLGLLLEALDEDAVVQRGESSCDVTSPRFAPLGSPWWGA